LRWLTEDPWLLASFLAGLGLCLLVAVWLTQQGKYLVAGLGLLALAGLVLLFEWLWVTEAERVEAVIRDLGRAVARSDAQAVLDLMAPEVALSQGSLSIGGPQVRAMKRFVPGLDADRINPARALIRSIISETRFDFLSIRDLRTQAGKLTRRGKADFRVYTSGSYRSPVGQLNFATGPNGTDWSVGLREEEGLWKIDRITAVRLPSYFQIPGLGSSGP
jgi:hypothetical protein